MPSKKEIAIQANHIWKLFRKQKQRTAKEMIPALISGGKKNIVETFWALKDVNFTINTGEIWGIIGPNGSGKSTLMKMFAGLTLPTKGEIIVNGKIAPLIELGAGFHPELSGTENILLNGMILGMSKKEILNKYADIVNFAEINDFIDQPIKHYSSGMQIRLAFAVAIHAEFDILLMDEILAVGDNYFQNKCLAKMDEFKQQGKTIIFVSHSLPQVKSFCQKGIYLRYGEIKKIGDINAVCETYEKDF